MTANLGYIFTFGRHDPTILSCSLAADIAVRALPAAVRLRRDRRADGDASAAAAVAATGLRRVAELSTNASRWLRDVLDHSALEVRPRR
jgi:uncharacterized metal-binding protein